VAFNLCDIHALSPDGGLENITSMLVPTTLHPVGIMSGELFFYKKSAFEKQKLSAYGE